LDECKTTGVCGNWYKEVLCSFGGSFASSFCGLCNVWILLGDIHSYDSMRARRSRQDEDANKTRQFSACKVPKGTLARYGFIFEYEALSLPTAHANPGKRCGQAAQQAPPNTQRATTCQPQNNTTTTYQSHFWPSPPTLGAGGIQLCPNRPWSAVGGKVLFSPPAAEKELLKSS